MSNHRNLPLDSGESGTFGQIGIALSGGGVRAAVFHLGVLSHLATASLLEQVSAISTVSGGTLATGLIFATNRYRWPTSSDFFTTCLPLIRERLLDTNSIQRHLLKQLVRRPWRLASRSANLLAAGLTECWGIASNLQDLPSVPRWIINATTYETGKNWRFVPPHQMGDYAIGYVQRPDLPLAEAMAASAAVPGLIGAYELVAQQFEWYTFSSQADGSRKSTKHTPPFERLHLWDGSVYDFLGTEPFFKVGSQPYPTDVEFLIVSDAAQPLGAFAADAAPLYQRAHRLVTIATDQVRSLRTRSIVNHFQLYPGSGAFLKIGTPTSQKIGDDDSGELWTPRSDVSLSPEDRAWAANLETTLRSLTAAEFDLLYLHGREVAAANLKKVQSN